MCYLALHHITLRIGSCVGTQEQDIQTQPTNIFVKDSPQDFSSDAHDDDTNDLITSAAKSSNFALTWTAYKGTGWSL